MAETSLIESVPEDFPYETVSQIGAGMMVTGFVGLLIGLARGRRGGATRTGSIGVLVLGFALAAGTLLLQRQVKIEGAENRVIAELDARG